MVCVPDSVIAAVVATRQGAFTATLVVRPFNLSVIVEGIFDPTKKAAPKDGLVDTKKGAQDRTPTKILRCYCSITGLACSCAQGKGLVLTDLALL
jgi:hypothetical protein